jgi:hypothetical protein
MAKQLIPAVNSKEKWMKLGFGFFVGVLGFVLYNNYLSPTAQAGAARIEPTYALRRFGGFGNERNVFGSVFDPQVRGWRHATHPADRARIRAHFRARVEDGVRRMAMDKNTVANNIDRVRTVVQSQDKRLDEVLKSKPTTLQEIEAEINAAIHEILQIFDIPSHAMVQFGMFPS